MRRRLLVMLLACGGCVDSSPTSGDAPRVPRPKTAEPIVLDLSDPVPAEFRGSPSTGPYRWQNVTIKGGGFVSGIIFSATQPNLIYARTDVGGAYRWNMSDERWVPITDFIGPSEANSMGIESIATDPVEPNRVYLAAGTYLPNHGDILASEDYGTSWTRHAIPVEMGGNADGRSMGERLAIDPNRNATLYLGSRNNGLWTSADFGASWRQVTSFTGQGDANMGLSFVVFDPRSSAAGAGSRTIYVGAASLTLPTLYRSVDSGASWQEVIGAPRGFMPHHAVLGPDGVMYLAYNNGPGPNGITSGAIWKLNTNTGAWTDVSPDDTGFGGVTLDMQRPATLTVSSIDVWPDEIHRSIDGGRSWFSVGGGARRDPGGAEWLYFGGEDLTATGWMGDIEIDPFNRSRALYVTGQGIWWTDNLTDADPDLPTDWLFRDDGLEETVALDLASPPEGAELLSAVGDIAGFRHDDLDTSPPGGMYENPVFGNTTSLDFAENVPSFVVRTGTAGGMRRRGAWSSDGGTTWQPFASEPSGTRGSGSIAVSADATSIVWSGSGCRGSMACSNVPHYSIDQGVSWHETGVKLADGGVEPWTFGSARVAADRVNPSKFYAVAQNTVFISTDGGASFAATPTLGLQGGRPRPVFGVEGDVWLVTNAGLYRSTDSAASFTRVVGVNIARAVGFGRAAPGATYPSVYLSGAVATVLGIYRSDDAGASWTRINDDQTQFGYVDHISGDPRIYGRVYLGTGGRGIVYGDPR